MPDPWKRLQPDAQQILLKARRRRAKGLVASVVVLLGCSSLALYYRLYAGLFGSFLLGPVVILFVIWTTRSQRGDKLVLWLRRFHVRRSRVMLFEQLLVGACTGFGFPLTVQDSTFKRSLAMSAIKMQILSTPLILAFAVAAYVMYRGLLFVIGLAFPALLSSPGSLGVVFWLTVGVWVLGCVWAGVFGYRRLGYVLLKPATAREQTLQLIRKIQKRRGWQSDAGVFVIHCDDSFWREIVQLCMACASATVIDVTELSENVIWELETAFRLVAPESIILACGVDEGASKELPDQVREQLLAHLPLPSFARAQTFFYPLCRTQLKQYPWSSRKALRTELEARLATGITQCSACERSWPEAGAEAD